MGTELTQEYPLAESYLDEYSAFSHYLIGSPVEGHLSPGDVAVVVSQGALVRLSLKRPALERFISLIQAQALIPVQHWGPGAIAAAVQHSLPPREAEFVSAFGELLVSRMSTRRDVIIAMSSLAKLLPRLGDDTEV